MPPPFEASETFSFQTFQRIAHGVQEAGDRQTAIRAAVRQHRRRGHEPQLGHIVIDALGVLVVVGVGRGNAGEHVLIGLARQQIAVLQRLLAEVGQQVVARSVQLDRRHDRELGTDGFRRRNRLDFHCLQRFAASHYNPHRLPRTLHVVSELLNRD